MLFSMYSIKFSLIITIKFGGDKFMKLFSFSLLCSLSVNKNKFLLIGFNETGDFLEKKAVLNNESMRTASIRKKYYQKKSQPDSSKVKLDSPICAPSAKMYTSYSPGFNSPWVSK